MSSARRERGSSGPPRDAAQGSPVHASEGVHAFLSPNYRERLICASCGVCVCGSEVDAKNTARALYSCAGVRFGVAIIV